jgi:putative membrane protein
MGKLLLRVIIFTGAVFLASQIVSGIAYNGIAALIIAGALLALLHTLIKPIIKVITLPLSIITFGLFALVINAAFFWFVGNVIPGFSVSDFVAAFWGSIIVSIANWLVDVTSNDD